MDGFETLKELRSFSTVPVIILTAKDTDADKIKGLNLGADDYLSKPFNPDELVARMACPPKLGPISMRQSCRITTGGQMNENKKIFGGAGNPDSPGG
jgi:CheY-like chemotaxis protein